MLQWRFKLTIAWGVVFLAVILMLAGCENSTSPSSPAENESEPDTSTSPPETTASGQISGFIVVGNFWGTGIQTCYYDLERDILFKFGTEMSRDGVFSPGRDSVYFNYGDIGEGIWVCPIDSLTQVEPILVYNDPYQSELNLCRVPGGIIFNTEPFNGTFMMWDGTQPVNPDFSCGSGMVISTRVCPADSNLVAVEFWGLKHRTWIVDISSTPWDTLRTVPGDFFAWFDIDATVIVAGDRERLFIHQIYGSRDSVEIPLPREGLFGVATDGLRVFGVFACGDSTEIWLLEANTYTQRLVSVVPGNPTSFDISPFESKMAVATSRGEWDYVSIIDLDSGTQNDVLMGNTITRVRWK